MDAVDHDRTAIVLMNLGGPDGPDAVRPFLFNLFNDPAIISVPAPFRTLLAWLIARRRTPVAKEIYARIGNRSPILPETEAQARALQAELGGGGDDSMRCFIAMRYWHPRAARTVAEVRDWGAKRVLLLPLYPQFSTTTAGSSIAEWHREAGRAGLQAPTTAICCYPELPGLVSAQADAIVQAISELKSTGPTAGLPPRILFSAHGLPKKVIAGGDPYQWQVEQTAAAIGDAIAGLIPERNQPEQVICYQSRVGPLEWIGPATDDEIRRAGRDGVPLIVVPIAFVSEHSETLVELDIEYAELAVASGVPAYRRIPALGTAPAFIDSLASLIAAELEGMGRDSAGMVGRSSGRICPNRLSRCPCGGNMGRMAGR